MTARERRSLLVSAVILLVASGIRWVHDSRARPPLFPPDSVGIRDELLAESEALLADEERRSRPLEQGELLDPNRAPAAELDRLPGVGPATADRIVEERTSGGYFRSAGELERVRGIGPATSARMAPLLDFEVPPPVTSRPPRREGAVTPAPSFVPVTTRSPEDSGGGPPPVDLNSATAVELRDLRGIGPVLAERIVAFREENGPFGRVEDLEAVRGVGPSILGALRPRLRVGPGRLRRASPANPR